MSDDKTTHFGFTQVPKNEKAAKVAGVFHAVANQYDLMNDVMSLGSHRLMKRFAVELTAVRAGHIVLDLAGGTGDLTARMAPLVGPNGQVILCDINQSMLGQGRDRLINRGIFNNINFLQADAEHLPLPENFLDVVTIAFGLRNFTNKAAALSDLLRTLKPGGKLVVLEFSSPQHPLIKAGYEKFSQLWPKIGKTLTGEASSYQYLVESIKMHPDQANLKQMFVDAGFIQCEVHNILNGIAAIHTGCKPWPEDSAAND
ncbi:MAG: class I SAM-dependent methyltransferase [Pseudomonadales bacterium]|nr:class I SAM-dependent methyltransferase [Pseudomonadales bacterium]